MPDPNLYCETASVKSAFGCVRNVLLQRERERERERERACDAWHMPSLPKNLENALSDKLSADNVV